MDVSSIKQKIGLLKSGVNSINNYVESFTPEYSIERDLEIRTLIPDKYNNVLIIGAIPLPLALTFDRVTLLEDSEVLIHFQDQLKELFGIDLIPKNPLFDNIQKDIEPFDLIIYHDSELLVPLDYFYHKHKDKDVLIMNTFLLHYKHNTNLAYSEQDLLYLYPMKDVYSVGRVPLVNNAQTYYSYGKLDD